MLWQQLSSWGAMLDVHMLDATSHDLDLIPLYKLVSNYILPDLFLVGVNHIINSL